MRRRLIRLVWMLMFFWLPAWAQNEYPKAEGFVGFSVLSVGDGDREQAFGWQASVAGNVHRNVGFVADFGGQYKGLDGATLQAYEFLFGPRFNARSGQATGFVHTLFGGAHIRGGGESTSGFMMGFGGGVDINAGNRVAVRLFQFDWLPSRFEGNWSKSNVRAGFGIVFKAGQ